MSDTQTKESQPDHEKPVKSPLNSKRIFEMIDEKTKYLVNGYIRELETEIQTQRNLNCPQEINDLCIMFAHTPPEHFTRCGLGLVLRSDDHQFGLNNKVIHNSNVMTDSHWRSTIGEYEVNCGLETNAVYEWTILVEHDTVSIGIVSTALECDVVKYAFRSGAGTHYALGNNGMLEYNDNKIAVAQKKRYDGYYGVTAGNMVKMTLDVGQRTLSFAENGKDLGVAYDNIDDGHTYKLAISCYVNKICNDVRFVKLQGFSIDFS